MNMKDILIHGGIITIIIIIVILTINLIGVKMGYVSDLYNVTNASSVIK